jgi:WD40 repeat protein
VTDIVVTKDGKFITSSDDKSIRVWDRDGIEKRKILGEIGVGNQGKIYAIALSPDQKYLAVGGYLAGRDRSDWTAIRIYEYKSGKLIKLLRSHTNVINDLAFDPNSRYLISGSSDKKAKIWDARDGFSLRGTIDTHKGKVFAVKIIQRGKDYYAITAGDDNYIRLYNLRRKKEVKSDKRDFDINYLALSDDHIAASGNGREIVIYDYKLKIVKTIHTQSIPKGLSYSPNGKFLIAGAGADDEVQPVTVYSVDDDYALKTNFKRHKGPVRKVAFLDDNTALSVGSHNHKIYMWDIDSGAIKRVVGGVGEPIWSVGIDGNKIAWGDEDDCRGKNCSSLKKIIDLDDFKIVDSVASPSSFHRISTTYGDYKLSHSSGGMYGYDDASLDLTKDGNLVVKITRESYDGIMHHSYGFYKNYIISGGSDGYLDIYDLQGRHRASLVGHIGDISSLALDGDRLVSGSSDQTIRVWDLSILEDDSSDMIIKPMLNIFVSRYDRWIVWSKSGYYTSSIDGDKFMGYHVNQGVDKEAIFLPSANFYSEKYIPKIIEYIIKYGDEKEAIARLEEDKRVTLIKKDIRDILPSEIKLESEAQLQTSDESIKVLFSIVGDADISNILFMKNGRPVVDSNITKRDDGKYSIDIKLSDGLNIIMAMIRDQYSTSMPITIEVVKESIDDIFKPTLYMLSIGVSKYQNREYDLKYASKDASDMVDLFSKQKNIIFRDIKMQKLVDENATKDNILGAFDWLDREVTQRDVVIIFIAGHGVNKSSNDYYFFSHEADINSIRRSAVNWRDFKDIANRLPSKVILLIDTCHSGNINGGKRDLVGAIKSITSSGTGEIIMTATTANGYSLEDDAWQNGAFTRAFLDGIDGMEADYNQDNTVSIKEIDLFVTMRVKELTDGEQKPTTIMPDSIPDFAIWHRPQ